MQHQSTHAPAERTESAQPWQPPHPLLRSKLFLYLTEFFSGVSVMAVELGASRLLAPYFSSSQIVWTIIIGMIMIAMALGNLYGGRIADKKPDPALLYRRLLIAALWLAAIPLAGKYVILGVSGLLVFTVSTGFLIAAAFCSCLLLFVFPLFLLGTVTPSLVKYTVSSLSQSGRTVGRLGACNTVGSILGTFLPTFVTIPAWGTAVTFLLFSGLLLALSLAYFLTDKARRKRGLLLSAAALILFILLSVLGASSSFSFRKDALLYEGESVYNALFVEENERSVILSTNVLFGVQSVSMKEDTLTGMYYDYALAAPAVASAGRDTEGDPLSVLILGGGTCTYGRLCLRYFPGCHVESVEIDRKIIDLAGKYFSMPEEVEVTEYDGRAYLQACPADKVYDVILVDAYQDITIPFQMSSVEFFTLVKEHLRPGGVLAVNMNMRAGGEGSISEALTDTVASVFPCVAAADVPGNTNRVLLASADEPPELALAASLAETESGAFESFLSSVAPSFRPVEGGGHVLTDDRAPVELLGIRAIDSIIEEELAYYKAILREGGVRALLRSLGVG